MMKQFLTLALIVLMIAILPASVHARTLSDWSNVQGLRMGTGLTIATRDGQVFTGDLKQVDDTSLTLLVRYSDSARQAVILQRDQVREVRKKKSRLLGTILGAGIGFGVGVGVGAISDARHPYSDDSGIGKVIFGLLGVLGGTAAGSVLPIKGKKIYVAP